MDLVKAKHEYLCNTYSDIHEHLPTLYEHARQCESIIELGVRKCVSTWSLVYGLLNNGSDKKSILVNDILECDITELLNATKDLDIDVKYEWKNDLELDIDKNVDLTFIDTWHVYGQLKRELNKFSAITNKYIIMHDTTVDAIEGESLRFSLDVEAQSRETGIPVEEIKCGLWKAVEEFLENNENWILNKRYENNNGLTILERVK